MLGVIALINMLQADVEHNLYAVIIVIMTGSIFLLLNIFGLY